MSGVAALSVTPESGEDSPSGASLRGSHRLAAVDVCERLWALRYHWYFRPAWDTPYRLGGTLIHTAYQYWYASMMAEAPGWFKKQSLVDRVQEQSLAVPEPVRSELVRHTWENFTAYRAWFEKDRELFKVV
jgi:hypothetical protein